MKNWVLKAIKEDNRNAKNVWKQRSSYSVAELEAFFECDDSGYCNGDTLECDSRQKGLCRQYPFTTVRIVKRLKHYCLKRQARLNQARSSEDIKQ